MSIYDFSGGLPGSVTFSARHFATHLPCCILCTAGGAGCIATRYRWYICHTIQHKNEVQRCCNAFPRVDPVKLPLSDLKFVGLKPLKNRQDRKWRFHDGYCLPTYRTKKRIHF